MKISLKNLEGEIFFWNVVRFEPVNFFPINKKKLPDKNIADVTEINVKDNITRECIMPFNSKTATVIQIGRRSYWNVWFGERTMAH